MKKMISVVFIFCFSFSSFSQSKVEYTQSSIDSAVLLINQAGDELVAYKRHVSIANTVTILGALVTIVGVLNNNEVNSSTGQKEVSPMIGFGVTTTLIGSIIHMVAPRKIGYAGNKLKKIKLNKVNTH